MVGRRKKPMTDVLFYHLTNRPLEAALPELLEKTLGRGWRAVVRCASPERRESLGRVLWTYRDDSFLPHGAASEPMAERQPILLTDGPGAPNEAQALFLVDGVVTDAAEMARFERCCLMFDNADAAAVAAARGAWKDATTAGLPCVYWAQDEAGRWRKKAESGV
jgi:DNA polymerase-3 subunit chi